MTDELGFNTLPQLQQQSSVWVGRAAAEQELRRWGGHAAFLGLPARLPVTWQFVE